MRFKLFSINLIISLQFISISSIIIILYLKRVRGDQQYTQPTALQPLHRMYHAMRYNETAREHVENYEYERGIVMSCPYVPSKNSEGKIKWKGKWKPLNPAYGVETVIKQLITLNFTSLPLYVAYYSHEQYYTEGYCKALQLKYSSRMNVQCMLVEKRKKKRHSNKRYPVHKYGYAKIFAIQHAPIREVLWFDCDLFPVSDLTYLFDSEEYLNAGAL